MTTTSARAIRDEDLLSLYSDPDTCPTDDLTLTPLVEEEAFVTWQQDIPRSYMATSPAELDERIRAARETLGERVVILGHHYQRDEVIQYADHIGDSFKLAQLAQAQSAAEYVVFCGVHFMAESADILTPPEVSVILPNMAAGCSMADMAEPGTVFAAWDEITAVLSESDTVIPITYMNSAASLKAFVGEREGIVCTSSNAPKTFDYAFERGNKILFFPDQHLGRNTGWDLGIPLEEMVTWDYTRPLGGLTKADIQSAKVILWKGHCSTHQRFSVEQIEKARAEYPGLNVIVHPESSWEVVQAADFAGSTERIVAAIADAPTGSVWGVGTEINLVNRLAQEHPDKTVFSLDPVVCPCSTMYRIHPAYLAWVLEGLVEGRVLNEIRVDDETRKWSLVALERMLALP